jgi:hypothetical protein
MLVASVSFFNELVTEKKNYFQDLCFIFQQGFHREEKLCSNPLFHFLMSFPQRRKTMLKTFFSFFNELPIEKKKLFSKPLLDHGFQEDNAMEGIHVKGQTSAMASRRSLLDGRKTL